MKFFLLLGGSIGFAATFLSALHAGAQVGFALVTGALGCLGGAALFRGFHFVMMSCLKNLALESSQPPANPSVNGTH